MCVFYSVHETEEILNSLVFNILTELFLFFFLPILPQFPEELTREDVVSSTPPYILSSSVFVPRALAQVVGALQTALEVQRRTRFEGHQTQAPR